MSRGRVPVSTCEVMVLIRKVGGDEGTLETTYTQTKLEFSMQIIQDLLNQERYGALSAP